MRKVYASVGRLLERGESVVLISRPFGALYDLIEAVNHSVSELGLTKPTFHVVSPVARASLQLCDMFGEWMSAERQRFLFEPRSPMVHGELLESKQLRVHPTTDAFLLEAREPFVLFLCSPDQAADDFTRSIDLLADRRVHFFVL
ncbi:Integrator complex subunit 9, partial [Cladochytrium tenue]